jgi:putative copper resistance protein D
VAAVALALLGIWFSGAAVPTILRDPGPLVRWGLPVTQLVVNLTAAGMVGSLVLALFGLKAGARPFDTALSVASASAAIFTIAAGLTAFLTFLNVFNPKLDAGPEFGAQLGRFLTQQELGRAWLITVIAGAVLTMLTFAVRSWTATLLVAILAIVALVPMATQGHSGDLGTHDTAVISLALHTIGAAMWLGGLVLAVIVRPLLDRAALAALMLRYSSIALFAFIVVAISGIARSIISLQEWDALFSPYGAILGVKIVALVALGALGAWYRQRLLARLDPAAGSGRGAFWGLVTLELALMGVASGAAVALSRTAPPLEETLPVRPTPAEILTGSPVPPELTPLRWLTAWDIDLFWLLFVAFALFFYLAGVWRLHRRGDRWPLHRTILWVCGMLLLLWVTCGPFNAYQEYLFSVHMLGHMLLTMAIPVLLVPGSPITLAARAIRKRDDGTRGGREWILWAVHSPFARVVTNPWVAAGLFVGSLWVFYFTDLIRWAMYDHLGHEWMIVHFLITGYLFVLSLIGTDPVPYRLPYAGRLVLLIVVMATHAFFGIAIMMQSGLMVADWYGSMGRTWGATPLQDQYVGGGIAWSIGELPTLALAVTVAIQWSRSDERIQRRRDRQAERTGDADLQDYNAYLAQLAADDARRGE